MSDTLEIFGTEYTGVTGIKATDDNDQIKTYIRPEGTKSITENGTGIDVTNYASVNVSVSSGTPTLETVTKTYTPSTSQQTDTITPSSGYDGIEEVDVTVNAIPQGQYDIDVVNESFYTESNARKWRIRANMDVWDGYLPSDSYYGNYLVRNAVASGTIITPTESQQTVGGTKYMMEGAVTIGAIDSFYVGSDVARNDSNDMEVSGSVVGAPPGYYEQYAYGQVASGTATPAASISGSSASVSTGTNTLTLTKSVSNTPQVSAGYISSGTAGNTSVSLTASVTTKAAATITPGTSNQTIASGTYLTGTQTISGDANLVGSNIISGKSIFGVSGTVAFSTIYTGSSAPSASLGVDGDIYIQG